MGAHKQLASSRNESDYIIPHPQIEEDRRGQAPGTSEFQVSAFVIGEFPRGPAHSLPWLGAWARLVFAGMQ
jgi:hypothetical protein